MSFIRYEGIFGLGIKAVICVIVPNAIYAMIYLNIPELREQSKWILSKLKIRERR